MFYYHQATSVLNIERFKTYKRSFKSYCLLRYWQADGPIGSLEDVAFKKSAQNSRFWLADGLHVDVDDWFANR